MPSLSLSFPTRTARAGRRQAVTGCVARWPPACPSPLLSLPPGCWGPAQEAPQCASAAVILNPNPGGLPRGSFFVTKSSWGAPEWVGLSSDSEPQFSHQHSGVVNSYPTSSGCPDPGRRELGGCPDPMPRAQPSPTWTKHVIRWLPALPAEEMQLPLSSSHPRPGLRGRSSGSPAPSPSFSLDNCSHSVSLSPHNLFLTFDGGGEEGPRQWYFPLLFLHLISSPALLPRGLACSASSQLPEALLSCPLCLWALCPCGPPPPPPCSPSWPPSPRMAPPGWE